MGSRGGPLAGSVGDSFLYGKILSTNGAEGRLRAHMKKAIGKKRTFRVLRDP
jgi:hypothetical protein